MKVNICQQCKRMFKITNTRHTELWTTRRKKCTSCGARRVTDEISRGLHMRYQAAEKELADVKHQHPELFVPSIPVDPEMQEEAAYQAELDNSYEAATAKFRKSVGGKPYNPEPMQDDTTTEELDAMMRQLLAKPKT